MLYEVITYCKMLTLLAIQKYTLGSKIILGIFFAILLYMLLQFAVKLLEMGYVLKYKKPFFVHFYAFLRKLSPEQKLILKNQFTFYNKLSEKNKRYFEHRVASFINDKDFIVITSYSIHYTKLYEISKPEC